MPSLEAEIYDGDREAIYVLGESGQRFRIDRRTIERVDHPGNVLATAGAVLAVLGASMLVTPVDGKEDEGLRAAGVIYAGSGATMLAIGFYPWWKSRTALRDTKEPRYSPGWAPPVPTGQVPSAEPGVGAIQRATPPPNYPDEAKTYEPLSGRLGVLMGASLPLGSNRYADLVTPGFVMAVRFPLFLSPKGGNSFWEIHWVLPGVRDEATRIPDPDVELSGFGTGGLLEKSVGEYLRIRYGYLLGFDTVLLHGRLVTQNEAGEKTEWAVATRSPTMSLSPILGASLAMGGWTLGLESRLELGWLQGSLDGANGMVNGMLLLHLEWTGETLYRAMDTKKQ
jgi:hypothetical protein